MRNIILASFSIVAIALSATGTLAADKLVPDGKRAFGYLVKVCRIGRRPSGSAGMGKQQTMIAEHFTKFGAKVQYQTFDARHPLTGTPVRMANMIVSWHPKSKKRVLMACHYDTRPYPDRDRSNPRGIFIGANDGASGVALYMELAHHMKNLKPTYGVDFVFFDGEELIFGEDDEYFLGSKHFARTYRDSPPSYRYVCGVLIDMIADKRLSIYQEHNSLDFAPKVTRSVWATARKLRETSFVQRARHTVNDDHIPLNQIAGIPTCDLIDFDYPSWHTTRDIPSHCSGSSLRKVGHVLLHWMQEVPNLDQ